VVIPTHNRPDLLRSCLNSLARHAPVDTEIIVVDDGSCQGRCSAASGEFPGVKILRGRRRRGFCAAANAGIRAARGAVIELLNDDTEVTAEWTESALACFNDPKVAAVAPLVLRPCRDTDSRTELIPFHSQLEIDSAGDRYYLGGVAGKRGYGQTLPTIDLQPCRVFGASACSAFYRREVLLRVGAFPASFGAYFEDVDLAFRIHRAGYHIIFEPGSRVYHHGGGSYGSPDRRLLEQQSRNEERVFWRNLPVQAWPTAIPRHAAVLAGKAWRRWREGNLIPFLCGRLRVLGEIPDLAGHRRFLKQIGPSTNCLDWQIEQRFWG
jgi:GT2 family glycosyltransferase